MMIWRRGWSNMNKRKGRVLKISTKLKRDTLKLSLLAKILIKVTKSETMCLVKFMDFLPAR